VDRGKRAVRVGTMLATAMLIAACTSSPSESPTGSTASISSSTPGPGASNDGATQAPLDTTAPTLPVSSGPWQPVTPQDSVAGSQVLDVVWTGTRFIAAGQGLGGGGTFLRSADGKTWKPGATGATRGFPERIAAGPNGIAAVGTVDGKPAVWHSADGVHWTYRSAVFPTSLGSDDTVKVTDIAPTATGWVAVGRDDPFCQFNCGLDPLRALAWTSTDAEQWTRVGRQPSFPGAAINAVTATEAGGLVAAGIAGGHAAIWTSPDGLTWTRVVDNPMFGPQPGAGSQASVNATGVAAARGSIVVVAMAFDAGPGGAPIVMAWRSSDGLAWRPATVDGGVEGQVFDVAATSSGFLATGPSGASSCLGGIWSSTDGTAWTCEATDPAFEGFGPYAAAGSPTADVAVGLTNVGCEDESACPNGLPGAIWWRPIP